jgi:hypothetical protein
MNVQARTIRRLALSLVLFALGLAMLPAATFAAHVCGVGR